MSLSRKSQITIFVIIAFILVAIVGGFFVFRSITYRMPASITPVYVYYVSCLENIIEDGTRIMGMSGGRINQGDFETGSTYAPFSSHLDFAGGIPYWYYITNNGIAKENIPTKASMERELENFLEENAGNCNFANFEARGYNITLGKADADVTIQDERITADISQKISITYGEVSYTASSISAKINSRLGRFFNLAKEIYDYEQESMFLENYVLDVLYNYAPVSGVEFNCSPVIWNPYDVFSKLQAALEANLGMVKFNGNYYDSKKTNNYFIAGQETNIELRNNEAVRFLYSRNWAQRMEVWPTKGNLMIANPLGTQQGLAAMGFCYAPYKFVYDIYIPVLIQIYSDDGEEIFEFPVAVVINKNVPRESETPSSSYVETAESACNLPSTNISIYTYDINLNPIEADVKFKCIRDLCYLGKTKLDNATKYAMLEAGVPTCYNGMLIVNAKGYKEKRYMMSTNEESVADIILDKEYSLNLEIYVDGRITNNLALLILSEDIENISSVATTISYPYTKTLKIGEGYYDVDLKVFSSGNVQIPGMTTKQCVEVPKEGIAGFFGFTEEKCTEITIPSQQASNFLIAGGKTKYYILPSEIEGKSVMRIYASSIKTPASAEDIALSWDKIEGKVLDIQIA